MSLKTADYVQLLKDKYDLKSNYKVAQFLQVSDTAVKNWTKKGGTLDDTTAAIIAQKLEIDPEIIITACHLERAEKQGNDLVASIYRKLLKKLESTGTTGVAAALTVLIMNGIPPF